MLKTDVKELRKELKKAPNTEGIIDWLHIFYVDPENKVVWENTVKYYDLEEEEKFRYTAILNKTVSAGIGKDLFPTAVKQNELYQYTDLTDTETVSESVSALRDTLLASYAHTDPYLAVLAKFEYDVPTKAKDGAVLEDEGTMFTTLVFSICPAKLSSPALGFEKGEITDLYRRWTVGSPVFGFVYPSFDERTANLNEAAFYIKKSEGTEFLHELFEIEEERPDAEAQKETWNAIMTETKLTTEEASIVNEAILKLSEDNAFVEKEKLADAVEEAGADREKFLETYESFAGDTEMSASVISEQKVAFETGSAKITIPADKAAFIKTENINGVHYILIPVDGTVTLNGAEVKY